MESAEYINNYENRVTVFPHLIERRAGLHTRRSIPREYLGIIDEWVGDTDYDDAFGLYYDNENLQLFYKLATNLLIIYQLGNTNHEQCIADIEKNRRLQEYLDEGKEYYSQLENKRNSNNNKFSKKTLLKTQIDKIIDLYDTLNILPTIEAHYTNISRLHPEIYPILTSQLSLPIVVYRGYNASRHEDYKLRLLQQHLDNPAYLANPIDFIPGQEFLIPNFLATSVSHNSALRFSSPSSDNSIPSICWEIIIPPEFLKSIPYTYLSTNNVDISESPLNEAEILINIGSKLVYVTSFIIENMEFIIPELTAGGVIPKAMMKDKVLFHRFMFAGYENPEIIRERLMNMKTVCVEPAYRKIGKQPRSRTQRTSKTPYSRPKVRKRKPPGFYSGLGKRKLLSKRKRKNKNKKKVNKSKKTHG